MQHEKERPGRTRIFWSLLSCLTLLLVCSPRLSAQSPADANADTQLWPDLQISIRLNPRVSANFFGTLREGRNINALVSEQIGAGAGLILNRYLSLSPLYRFIANQPTPTRHSTEHRFYLDLTARLPLGRGFALVDRNRGELRQINGVLSRRYRNRLQLERAFSLHDHKITPYVAGELFYEDRYHLWSRSQYLIGARFPLQQHLTLDSYYMRMIDVRARPGHLHVIGTIVRLDF